MSVIFQNLTKEEADTYSLVLSASRVSHRPIRGEHGWDLWVKDAQDETALKAIEKYIDENQDQTDRSAPLYYSDYKRTFTGIWVSMGLLIFHVAIALEHQSEFFIKVFGASAFHIINGELYRTVTALMLHANALHILGNVVGLSLFGTAVCSIMGMGVGWLMILISGIAGNLINALLHMGGHVSIGASTSIFGAIGILSAYQFVKKFWAPGERLKAFLPLCGGLALLGVLGSGEHSDLMAHLFGFLSGMIAGSVYGVFIKRTVSAGYQAGFTFLILGIITAAWMRAF